jgi:hypothetical protein
MKRQSETNAELSARINSDPARRAQIAVEEVERELRRERFRKEVVPLLNDLHAVGLSMANPYELKRRPTDLKAAFPVLLQHLRRPYSNDALWAMAYLFETRAARPYWNAIVSLYESSTDDPGLQQPWRDRLASAIAEMAAKNDFAVLERLLRDPTLGKGRILLVRAAVRTGKEKG